jgi:arabinogalactan endo-1,4-beta-galactosidase
MPKVLAQGKAIEFVSAKRLVVRHSMTRPTTNPSFEQVYTPLFDGVLTNKVRFEACTVDYGAYLRKTLQQNSIDLYNGGAKVVDCRLIGSYDTCAVKVKGEVAVAD